MTGKIIEKILFMMFTRISPELREWIKKELNVLAEKAKKTKNPFDDMFVEFLKAIVNSD